jgi:hypothetical protein
MLSMFRSTPLLFLLLSRFVVVLQVCNSFLCAPRVIAAAFSYTDDYKAAPDPSNSSTNVWQYFYGVDIENRDGNYTRLGIYDPSHQERAFQGWVPTLGGFPFAGKNTSPDNQYGIEPGEGYLHTSNDGLGLAGRVSSPIERRLHPLGLPPRGGWGERALVPRQWGTIRNLELGSAFGR